MKNTAFMGSVVTSGEGAGIVVATGRETFFGETAALLSEVKAEGDLPRSQSAVLLGSPGLSKVF